MKVHVHVTLKREVLDPQGEAVRRALRSLGFEDVRDVRVGKLIELELDEVNPERARQRAERMAQRLLANPVIEDFEVRPAFEPPG